MSSAAQWEIMASVKEDVADFTQQSGCAAPPEATDADLLDMDQLRRSPPGSDTLAALTRALDVIEATATTDGDRRQVFRTVLESIAHDWYSLTLALILTVFAQLLVLLRRALLAATSLGRCALRCFISVLSHLRYRCPFPPFSLQVWHRHRAHRARAGADGTAGEAPLL